MEGWGGLGKKQNLPKLNGRIIPMLGKLRKCLEPVCLRNV